MNDNAKIFIRPDFIQNTGDYIDFDFYYKANGKEYRASVFWDIELGELSSEPSFGVSPDDNTTPFDEVDAGEVPEELKKRIKTFVSNFDINNTMIYLGEA